MTMAAEITTHPALERTLLAARFETRRKSRHPFYLIQLTAEAELKLEGTLVSDALAYLLAREPYTHVFLQTHGWMTEPDSAIMVPFSEFIAGMQDDTNMPTGPDFKPLFIAFTWESGPQDFISEPDALTRVELLGDALKKVNATDPVAEAAAAAAVSVARGADPENLRVHLNALANDAGSDLEDDPDAVIAAIAASRYKTTETTGTVDTAPGGLIPTVLGGVSIILNPLQRLLFGRLMNRGTRTGEVLRGVMAKLMSARRAKFCLMGNSLGGHVLAGALRAPDGLPYKAHTAFFVQGAVAARHFARGGRFSGVRRQVAGPVVCTTSTKDMMLSRLFEPFHGAAVGRAGFPSGTATLMRRREDAADNPYEFRRGALNTVNGSEFIDEGNPVVGGHGDFKEDETTMTYWAAVNTRVPDREYNIVTSRVIDAVGMPLVVARKHFLAPLFRLLGGVFRAVLRL